MKTDQTLLASSTVRISNPDKPSCWRQLKSWMEKNKNLKTSNGQDAEELVDWDLKDWSPEKVQVSLAGAGRQLERLIQVRGWAPLIFGSITVQCSLRTGTFDNSLSPSQFCDERYTGFTTFYITGLETSNTGPKPEVSKLRPVGQMWPNVAYRLFLNELWAKNHFYIF